jgi:hypothetical protein
VTQYLTRREMREAERAGLPPQPAVIEPKLEVEDVPQPEATQVIEAQGTPAATEVFLSRRERRLAEASGVAPAVETAPSEVGHREPEPITETSPVVVSDVILAAMEEVALEASAPISTQVDERTAPDFSASSMLAEPSTQSIVLDVAPEAISLPLDTGEILSTGSIAILPDPVTGSLTGALDGLNVDDADRLDAVTGVITTVDPVSALDVINQRVTVGVVPGDMLRKGWWQPWAYGALGLGLAVATIIATITIVTALGE